MKEVEILVKVDAELSTVLAKMTRFDSKGKKTVLDVYYFDPLRDDLKPSDELQLRRCFRIRSKGKVSYLTYKFDHFDERGIWSYSDENEVEISDFNQCVKIVEALGFQELVRIDNTKYLFLTELYEIVIENVLGLGVFLEVERLKVGDLEIIDQVKAEIRSFIDSFELETEEMNIGKPELMLRAKLNKSHR